MGKSSKNEFKKLIRKQNVTGQPLYLNFEKMTASDWEARCKKLERELAEARKDVEHYKSLYQSEKEITRIQDDTIRMLEEGAEMAVGDCGSSDRRATEFQRGLGLQIDADGKPDLYRLSDPHGDLIPQQKFDGAELEVSPGRGFRLGLHFKKK